MLELTAGLDFDAVGGLTMGADPIAAAMLHQAAAQGRQLDAFVVRKEAKAHGLQRQIEGPDIAGRRVLVVEDTCTTGGSPLAALAAVRAAGADPGRRRHHRRPRHRRCAEDRGRGRPLPVRLLAARPRPRLTARSRRTFVPRGGQCLLVVAGLVGHGRARLLELAAGEEAAGAVPLLRARPGLDVDRARRRLGRPLRRDAVRARATTGRRRTSCRATSAGRPMVAFDYSYETHSTDSKGNRHTTTHRYAFCALSVPAYLPRLELVPESFLGRLGTALGHGGHRAGERGLQPALPGALRRPQVRLRRAAAADDAGDAQPVRPCTSGSTGPTPSAGRTAGTSPAELLARLDALAALLDGIPEFVWNDLKRSPT